MNGKTIGSVVCVLVILIAAYELVGIWTDLPTISRVVQGWRDNGRGLSALAITVAFVGALSAFAGWLWHHLRKEKRTSL